MGLTFNLLNKISMFQGKAVFIPGMSSIPKSNKGMIYDQFQQFQE